jgi:hypothetical protein
MKYRTRGLRCAVALSSVCAENERIGVESAPVCAGFSHHCPILEFVLPPLVLLLDRRIARDCRRMLRRSDVFHPAKYHCDSLDIDPVVASVSVSRRNMRALDELDVPRMV